MTKGVEGYTINSEEELERELDAYYMGCANYMGILNHGADHSDLLDRQNLSVSMLGLNSLEEIRVSLTALQLGLEAAMHQENWAIGQDTISSLAHTPNVRKKYGPKLTSGKSSSMLQ